MAINIPDNHIIISQLNEIAKQVGKTTDDKKKEEINQDKSLQETKETIEVTEVEKTREIEEQENQEQENQNKEEKDKSTENRPNLNTESEKIILKSKYKGQFIDLES